MEEEYGMLLKKLLEGTIGDAELDRLAAGLGREDVRDGLLKQMDAMTALAEGCECQPETRRRLDEVFAEIERKIRRRKMRRRIFYAAAVLVPAIFIAALALIVNRQTQFFVPAEYVKTVTAKGERTQIVFQDGSRVSLNAGTTLRYPVKFGLWKREMWLDGEAYFEVSSNSSRPFVLDIGGASVHVKGTSFNVCAYSDDDEAIVTLDEGRVEVKTAKEECDMQPSEQVIFDRRDGSLVKIDDSAPSRASAWRTNTIVLDHAGMHDVLKKLERWYAVEFDVSDEAVYGYSYTFSSGSVPLESLLAELELLAPVRFTVSGDRVKVGF